MNDVIKLFVSGRLCLFGEHSDWAGELGEDKGYCLVIGTDQGLEAEVYKSNRFKVSLASQEISLPWEASALLDAAKDQGEFFRYCAGVAYQMIKNIFVTGGIDLRIIRMNLPLRKGVSSSAAVCILVAKAFNAIYQIQMFPYEIMNVAYLGERLTGSQCGRMDQACIYGKIPVLLTFQRSVDIRIEPVFPSKDIEMFFVDLAGEKETTKILSDLQLAYQNNNNVRYGLGIKNEAIVREAYYAINEGNAEWLGGLMVQAQEQFDRLVAPASREQLTSPLLHTVLSFKPIRKYIFGGKGVGSQGDGTAQFVARSITDRNEAIKKITTAFPKMKCFPLTIPKGDRR